MGIGWLEQWARFCKKERDSYAKYLVGCAALNKSSKSNTLDAFPKSTSFLAPPLAVSPFALPFRAIAAVAAAATEYPFTFSNSPIGFSPGISTSECFTTAASTELVFFQHRSQDPAAEVPARHSGD